MKITKKQLKQIIKEEIENTLRLRENKIPPLDQVGIVGYEDYDAWDDDPNVERINQILSTHFDLKDFEFYIDVNSPGEYHLGNRGAAWGLAKKTGYRMRDILDVLKKYGYEARMTYDGPIAVDPRYRDIPIT